jgi:hypothetical protein|nr:MAG TPA: Transcriptional activator HlyU [Caudoviricetes sp.]
MKTEFQYNEYGVCTNPKIVFTRNLGEWEIQVEIAQSPNGKWDFGYIINYNTGGGCRPVMLQKDDRGFTEEEARVQALKAVESFVRKTRETNKEDQSRLLDIIWEEMQPKLF